MFVLVCVYSAALVQKENTKLEDQGFWREPRDEDLTAAAAAAAASSLVNTPIQHHGILRC